MSEKYTGAVLMALAASIWGGTFVVSKIVLEVVQPLALLWLRYVVALIALVMAVLFTRQSWRMRPRDVALVIAIGAIGYAFSIWTQFLGTKLSTAQMGAMITSATPAFMVVFGRIILGERITIRRALSVGLATLGVLMVVGISGVDQSYEIGGAILFIAALTWAFMSVMVKRVPAQYSQLVVTSYAIMSATVLITPAGLRQMDGVSNILSHPMLWGGVLYLGIISTAGAFFLWNKGLQMIDAASGGLYFFFQPLVGTFFGWIILGEQVTITFWMGATLILVGVLLVFRE